MPRAGLSPGVVTAAAAELVENEGRHALTLAGVADELGVRAPSLYNHVEGLDALVRLVTLEALDRLAEVTRAAVMGRSGFEGIRSLAGAYRTFAVAHPGLYAMTQEVRDEDEGYREGAERVLEPVLAVLSGLGLSGDNLIHAARFMRSALHGFVTLEANSGFGLAVDLDESFGWAVSGIERGLGLFVPDDSGSRQPSSD